MDEMLGRVLGHYELVARLGSGGMGTVYRGVHQTLQQPRAVKVLRPDLSNEEDVVIRFRREATIAAGLRHPNIVLIYDVAEQDGIHYIVMDLMEGGTLRDIIRKSAPLPLGQAVDLLRQLASALDYAHAHGVIHRDIKPGNVMVRADGHVTLVDFGIARAAEEARLTRAGTVVGTAEYMAPEAFTSAGSDQNGDRYALGVIAYELLTGKAPFRGTPTAVTYAQIHTPPPPARSLNPAVPARVEQALLSQLAKDPADRFPDARRFVEAIALAAPRAEVVDAPTMILPPSDGYGRTPFPLSGAPPPGFPSLRAAAAESPSAPEPVVPLAAGTVVFSAPPKTEDAPPSEIEAGVETTPEPQPQPQPQPETPREAGTVIFRRPPRAEPTPSAPESVEAEVDQSSEDKPFVDRFAVDQSSEDRAPDEVPQAGPGTVILERPAVVPEPVAVVPEPVAVMPEPVPIAPQPVAVMPEPVPIALQPVAVMPEPVAVGAVAAQPETAAIDPTPSALAAPVSDGSQRMLVMALVALALLVGVVIVWSVGAR